MNKAILATAVAAAALLTAPAAYAATPTTSAAVPAPQALMRPMDTRPQGCSDRFKDPDPRERVINKDGVIMHEMSNPPVCAPSGEYLGTLSAGSHFVVYYADPKDPVWCYGYSVQIAKTGYIQCGDYN